MTRPGASDRGSQAGLNVLGRQCFRAAEGVESLVNRRNGHLAAGGSRIDDMTSKFLYCVAELITVDSLKPVTQRVQVGIDPLLGIGW